MKPFPKVTEAHVRALKESFDVGAPRSGETHDQLMVRAGHAEVIQFLENQAKD